MLRNFLLVVGLVGSIVGFFLQVVGSGKRTDVAPALPFFSLRFLRAGEETVRTWFESTRAYRQVLWGGIFSVVGGLALVIAWWFLD